MPDLNCTEFETRLHELVEDHRSLDELAEDASAAQAAMWRDLRARANACSHCRGLWNEFALLERVLPLCKELTPPVNLVDAVMARWREEEGAGDAAGAQTPAAHSESRSVWGRSLFTLLTVIAATVLACFAFLYSPGSEDDLPPTFPVATKSIKNPSEFPADFKQTNSNENTPNDTDADWNWQAMAEDAGSAYWALASDTADSFASAAVFVPARKPAEKPQANSEIKPATGWTKGIGAGLKPIGQDVGRAMGFLLDAIPGGNENTL